MPKYWDRRINGSLQPRILGMPHPHLNPKYLSGSRLSRLDLEVLRGLLGDSWESGRGRLDDPQSLLGNLNYLLLCLRLDYLHLLDHCRLARARTLYNQQVAPCLDNVVCCGLYQDCLHLLCDSHGCRLGW